MLVKLFEEVVASPSTSARSRVINFKTNGPIDYLMVDISSTLSDTGSATDTGILNGITSLDISKSGDLLASYRGAGDDADSGTCIGIVGLLEAYLYHGYPHQVGDAAFTGDETRGVTLRVPFYQNEAGDYLLEIFFTALTNWTASTSTSTYTNETIRVLGHRIASCPTMKCRNFLSTTVTGAIETEFLVADAPGYFVQAVALLDLQSAAFVDYIKAVKLVDSDDKVLSEMNINEMRAFIKSQTPVYITYASTRAILDTGITGHFILPCDGVEMRGLKVKVTTTSSASSDTIRGTVFATSEGAYRTVKPAEKQVTADVQGQAGATTRR